MNEWDAAEVFCRCAGSEVRDMEGEGREGGGREILGGGKRECRRVLGTRRGEWDLGRVRRGEGFGAGAMKIV